MTTSKIDWVRGDDDSEGLTWNPIRASYDQFLLNKDGATEHIFHRGWHCEKVHDGCRRCYSEKQNVQMARGGTGFEFKPGNRQFVDIYYDGQTKELPLQTKKPKRVFVCSMTDLFGPWVTDDWLYQTFAVMKIAYWHTFIVLTKRPERMRDFMSTRMFADGLAEAIRAIPQKYRKDSLFSQSAHMLPNVWAGASCSRQVDLETFMPPLFETPLARRLVSLEPLLEGVDVRPYLGPGKLDWVICGGESGKDASVFQVEWGAVLIEQCKEGNTPFFMKQVGSNPRLGTLGVLTKVDFKGSNPDSWPDYLKVRQWPNAIT